MFSGMYRRAFGGDPFNIDERVLDNILADASAAPIQDEKRYTAVRYLQVIWQKVSIIGSSWDAALPNRELTLLLNAATRALDPYGDEFGLIKDEKGAAREAGEVLHRALNAAAQWQHYMTPDDQTKQDIAEDLYLVPIVLRRIRKLILLLADAQRQYLSLSNAEQVSWPFRASSTAELKARQAIFPYVQSTERISVDGKRTQSFEELGLPRIAHETPEILALRQVAQLYHFLFEKQLTMSRDPYAEAGAIRYKGPGFRFTVSTLRRLHLIDYFLSTQYQGHSASELEVAVLNKIGDMWGNYKRSSQKKN